MLERLANILYWCGCAVSTLLVVGGITAAIFDNRDFTIVLLFFWIAAGFAWLAGKGVRYVLTGRTDNRLSGLPPHSDAYRRAQSIVQFYCED